MNTIESYLENRKNYRKEVEKAIQNLKNYDFDFFSENVENLFKKYPLVRKISWCQGYVYNDQVDVFGLYYLYVNDVYMSWYPDYYDREKHEEWLSSDSADTNIRHNYDPMNDTYGEDWRNIISKMDKEEFEQMKQCATDFASFMDILYNKIGKRYFLDNFGSLGIVIFEPGRFHVKQYKHDRFSDEGYLEWY